MQVIKSNERAHMTTYENCFHELCNVFLGCGCQGCLIAITSDNGLELSTSRHHGIFLTNADFLSSKFEKKKQ